MPAYRQNSRRTTAPLPVSSRRWRRAFQKMVWPFCLGTASPTTATAVPLLSGPRWERLRDLAASGAPRPRLRPFARSPGASLRLPGAARRRAYAAPVSRSSSSTARSGVSPEDDLLLQVQGMVAEYERAKILERSRRGKRHRARSRVRSTCSRGRRYGYRYLGKHDGGGIARYEIVEDQARVVRQGLRLGRPRPRQHRRGVPALGAGRAA